MKAASNDKAKKVLCVHSNCELYGSDRMFLMSAAALRKLDKDLQIECLLPCYGLLDSRLQPLVDSLRTENFVVLRRADNPLVTLANFLAAIIRIPSTARRMSSFSMTYISTSVVFEYIVAARFSRSPTVLHVHEMPGGLTRLFISALVRFSGAHVIYCSKACSDGLRWVEGLEHSVIHGSVADASGTYSHEKREQKLNVLFIGRLNHWKGQALLLRGIALLPLTMQEKLSVKFVGDVYGRRTEFREALEKELVEKEWGCKIELHGFVEDPSPYYSWSDVVVVPSTKPEPFGLVATEAMSAGRAVIASNHGGLREIVQPMKTGVLFEPGSAEAICAALKLFIEDRTLSRRLGESGRREFEEKFTIDRYTREFQDATRGYL